MDAGALDRRLDFERSGEADDGAGNTLTTWVHQFTAATNRKWLRGGESVMAARLENRQTAILTIRNSAQARQIDNDWRAVDRRDGRVYNVRETPRESDDSAWLELLVECGVAV